MSVKHVEIPDIGKVALYKRKGNRSLRLSVGLGGEVRVSLPYWVPYKAAEEFVKAKAGWIANNKYKKVSLIEHGSYIGKHHRIYFDADGGRSSISTRVHKTEVYVVHPLHIDPTDQRVQDKAHKASIRALKQEAERLLPERLEWFAEHYGYTFRDVTIKQLKSRWGSCSSRQEITLNLYLMQLPWHLIDYVIMHELVHTKVMRHGPPFWHELEQHLPNARKLREEINTYQPILTPKPLAVA